MEADSEGFAAEFALMRLMADPRSGYAELHGDGNDCLCLTKLEDGKIIASWRAIQKGP